MASESLAAGISAVVSAVVTTVVGVLIQWGKRASDFLARTFRPDHSALFEGLLLLTGSGLQGRVAIAPVWRRRGTLHPDSTISFIRHCFGVWFLSEPSYSSTQYGVRFLVQQPPEAGVGQERRIDREVRTNGRVELYWTMDVHPDPNDANSDWLPLEDVVQPLIMLLSAIGPDYYQLGGFQRRNRNRFDWYFAVGTHLTRPDGTMRYWKARFPGRQARRASENVPSCPPMGYANEDLRSWDRRQPWPELVKQALAGLLEYNGYYDFTDALEDTIGAVRERLGAEAVPTGTRGA